MQWELH